MSEEKWRTFLTVREARTLERIDEAKQAWRALNKDRYGIVHRAMSRARAAAKKESPQP